MGKVFGLSPGSEADEPTNYGPKMHANPYEAAKAIRRSKDVRPDKNGNIDYSEAIKKVGVDSYKKGGTVKKTGLALVHKGEKVIPKEKAGKMEGNMRMSTGGFMKCK